MVCTDNHVHVDVHVRSCLAHVHVHVHAQSGVGEDYDVAARIFKPIFDQLQSMSPTSTTPSAVTSLSTPIVSPTCDTCKQQHPATSNQQTPMTYDASLSTHVMIAADMKMMRMLIGCQPSAACHHMATHNIISQARACQLQLVCVRYHANAHMSNSTTQRAMQQHTHAQTSSSDNCQPAAKRQHTHDARSLDEEKDASEDGSHVYHRLHLCHTILAAASPVWRALFTSTHEWKEQSEHKITLQVQMQLQPPQEHHITSHHITSHVIKSQHIMSQVTCHIT